MNLKLTHPIGVVFKGEVAEMVVAFKEKTGKKNKDIYLKGIDAFLADKKEVEEAV